MHPVLGQSELHLDHSDRISDRHVTQARTLRPNGGNPDVMLERLGRGSQPLLRLLNHELGGC